MHKALLLALLLPASGFAFDTHDIVAIAASELGHDDGDARCRGEGCYFARGSNWCSEFVSWVYLEAGAPFDGGRRHDWLLVNVEEIIAWFEARRAFVRRTDPAWADFVPAPGDYVWIGRVDERGEDTGRMHSGIVEFVDSQGALHTIEGNNAGRPVARFVYPDYAANATDNGPANGIVLGFGHRDPPPSPAHPDRIPRLIARRTAPD